MAGDLACLFALQDILNFFINFFIKFKKATMTSFKPSSRTLRLAALAALTSALGACATNGNGDAPSSSARPMAALAQGQGPVRLVGGHSLDFVIGAYDVNRDGTVTKAEYDSVLEGQFRSADTNGDGVLSEAEYVAEFETRFQAQMKRDGEVLSEKVQAQIMKQAHRRFRVIDADGNGSITRAEAKVNADAAYERWDADHDGVITAADRREGNEFGGDNAQERARDVNNFIASYDADGDGVVTRAEYNRVREQRFATADTNGDGWLSEAEYVGEFEKRFRASLSKDGKKVDEDFFAGAIKQAHRRFRVLDKNEDGRMTKVEALAQADKTFQSRDHNRDGAVTRADARPTMGSGGPSLSVEEFIRTYDDAGEGRVTRAQYEKLREQRFEAADVDGDGQLTKDEFINEYADRLKQQYQRTGRMLEQKVYDAAIKQTHTRFDALDSNKDGRLSKDEALALADRFFRNADLNNDGVVDSADKSLQERRGRLNRNDTKPADPAGFSKVKPQKMDK